MTRVSHGIDRIDVIFDEPNLVANAGLLLVATLTDAARVGGVDRRHGAPGRPGRWCPSGPQGVDVGPRDDRRRHPHRSRRHAARRFDRRGVGPSGDGPVDAGHVPARLHVRSCPPARSRHRPGARAGLGGGCRSRRRAVGDRHRLDDLSRSTASTSRAPGSATPRCSATTRSSPPAPTPVRCCTPGCAKGQANTQRGARRFIDELVARVRRAGATGQLTVRMDSGFWSNDTITTLNRLDVRYTMAVRTSITGRRRGDRHHRRGRLGRHRLHRRRPSPSRRVRLHHRHADGDR